MKSKRVALVVGVGNYKNFEKLVYCPSSAIDVYHLLIDEQFGCCDPDRSILLIGQDQSLVTEVELINGLKKIASQFTIGDELIFFFCGHGQVELDEYILLLSDSYKYNNIILGGFPFGRFFDYIGKSIDRAVMIIDACHSGAIDKYFKDKNISFIWSCGTEYTSEQSDKLGKTYFSYYLCKGIQELRSKDIEIGQLTKYIKKHHSMNQEAGCCTAGDIFLSKKNNSFFINRKDELSGIFFDKNNLIRCKIIDAPEGCGKTAILYKIKNQFEEKGVRCFLIKINSKQYKEKDSRRYFLKNLLLHISGNEIILDTEDDYLLQIVKNIQQTINDRINYIDHEIKFLLMIDFSHGYYNEFLNYLFKIFIPYVIKHLAYSENLSFIISGRYLSRTIYRDDVALESNRILLPAFSYEHVRHVVTSRFNEEKNAGNFLISEAAAHLFFFSGGHLGSIAHILEKNGFDVVNFQDIIFRKRRKHTLETYIFPVAENIINSFDEEVQKYIGKLSVFRYYDIVSIKKFLKFNTIEAWNILSIFINHSILTKKEDGLFYNEIIRGIMAAYFREKKTKEFISYCKEAQDICLERIKKVQRAECWVAEYLFQVFQELSLGYLDDIYAYNTIKSDMIKNHIHKSIETYINRENKDNESSDNDKFYLIEKIINDKSLRFMANYLLCWGTNSYSEEPFEELKRKISVFL